MKNVRCCRGALLLEAVVSLAILALLVATAAVLTTAIGEHRATSRARLAMRADLSARAEGLRATGYAQLAALQPESVETVALTDCRYRLTTRVAEADPASPGLLRVRLDAELLDDNGRVAGSAAIELRKARRQWAP